MTVIETRHMILDKALFLARRFRRRNFMVEDAISAVFAEVGLSWTDHFPVRRVIGEDSKGAVGAH